MSVAASADTRPKIVGYVRVSSGKKPRVELDPEAQDAAIRAYVADVRGEWIKTFKEIENGHRKHRPDLQLALALAKKKRATLVIGTMIGLNRDTAFLSKLQESSVKVVPADIPNAAESTLSILLAVAKQERELVSRRISEALQRRKRRGKKLGNPNGAAALRRAGKGNAAGLAAIKTRADARAAKLAPIVRRINREGTMSLGGLAWSLNARHILTPRGKRWHKSSVRNLLARIAALADAPRADVSSDPRTPGRATRSKAGTRSRARS